MSIIAPAARNTNGAGAAYGNRRDGSNRADLPQATVWANVGYTLEGAGPDGGDVFISLPVGLPIDTMTRVNESSNNAEFSNLQQARNALLDQLIGGAGGLEPGEERIVNLQVQLRRVKDKAVQPVENNPLVAKIDLFG